MPPKGKRGSEATMPLIDTACFKILDEPGAVATALNRRHKIPTHPFTEPGAVATALNRRNVTRFRDL